MIFVIYYMDSNTSVSMNMWVFTSDVLDRLEVNFTVFLLEVVWYDFLLRNTDSFSSTGSNSPDKFVFFSLFACE